MRPTADQSLLSKRERLFLLASQAVNAVFFAGDSDESLSARCWRLRRDPIWSGRMKRIDRFLGVDHCMNSYLAAMLREMHRSARANQGSTQ
jgi:hypothetical protein